MNIGNTELIVSVVAAALVGLVVGALRVERRTRGVGAPAMRWATTALYLIRAGLLVGVVATAWSTISPPPLMDLGTMSRGVGGISIDAATVDFDALCSPYPLPNDPGRTLSGGGCEISRSVRGAHPLNAQVLGVAMSVGVGTVTSGERLRYSALALAGKLVWVVFFFALERMLSNTALRRPFASGNIGWLRVIAATVVIAGWLLPKLVQSLAADLVARYGHLSRASDLLESSELTGGPLSPLLPFGIAILILLLAEIWRFGINLQNDVEATV